MIAPVRFVSNELSERALTSPSEPINSTTVSSEVSVRSMSNHTSVPACQKAVHVMVVRRFSRPCTSKPRRKFSSAVLFARSQIAEQFGRIGRGVRAWCVNARRLALEDHLDVSIVTELIQQDAVPVTGRRMVALPSLFVSICGRRSDARKPAPLLSSLSDVNTTGDPG